VIIYRKASILDIEQIILLEEKMLKDNLGKSILTEVITSDNGYVSVALDGNTIVGYVSIMIAVDYAEILNICVDDNYQLLGIGTHLLNDFFNKYNEIIKSCSLEVRVNNDKAINFYHNKFNFNIVNTRKKYYQDNTDAYIMEKIL